jgi:exosortase
MTKRSILASALVCTAILGVYLPVLSSLVRQWASDENYSHGFIIIPFALYFAWQQRRALAIAPTQARSLGLVLVVASLFMMLAGLLAAELFLTRVSLIGVVAGSIWFLWGSRHVRLLGFPILLLFLMVPLPAMVFNQIAFPLQLLASRVGETVLAAVGVPVLREGNVLELVSTKLEVAQACSGIRSLISLLTLGIILGKLTERRLAARFVLAAVTIPIAIAANAARVAGTGLAANWIGPEAAEGFFHVFSGWLVFVAAFGLLLLAQRGLAYLAAASSVGPPAQPLVREC